MLNNSDIQNLKDIFYPKFDEINERLDKIEKRLDVAEKRIEFLMEEVFEIKQIVISMDKRLTRLEESSYFSSQRISTINKTLKVAGKVLISNGQTL